MVMLLLLTMTTMMQGKISCTVSNTRLSPSCRGIPALLAHGARGSDTRRRGRARVGGCFVRARGIGLGLGLGEGIVLCSLHGRLGLRRGRGRWGCRGGLRWGEGGGVSCFFFEKVGRGGGGRRGVGGWGDVPRLPESTHVACYVAGDAEVWGWFWGVSRSGVLRD